MKSYKIALVALLLGLSILNAQENKDKAVYREYKNPFYDEMLKQLDEVVTPSKNKSYKVDLSGYAIPKSLDEFKIQWHNEPLSQGRTGTCWSFSTTSFFESEVYRLQGKKVKLSEMYTAYYEYIEKARRFVRERGNSNFAEGSEADALLRLYPQYGIVPLSAYSGTPGKLKIHDHEKMFDEMNNYLKSVKLNSMWNEEQVLQTIASIMNSHIGTPPTEFEYEGKKYTPKSFLTDFLKLKPEDYVAIISLKQDPYYAKMIYNVPDNWWYSADYYNIPLAEFMSALKSAIRNGYTVSLGGDTSEPGIDGEYDVAIVPDFDIPAAYINEDARQMRFNNGTTTDDHGIHLVGYKEENGKDWFLIKDSGGGGMNGKFKGYYFYHEDYVKLKMVDFLIHKDAVKDLLVKFK